MTLKLSWSFFSSDESSTIDVVMSTARYARKLLQKRYTITIVEISEIAPPVTVASVRSAGTFR